jgi:ssDNA-binding Zn-finger/Zn-ribbon topoisomerase 1
MKPENVKCPECDGEMVSRTGKYGTFWGCKSYPKCKGTRDSMGRSKAEVKAERLEEEKRNGQQQYDESYNSANDKFRFRRT